MSQTQKYPLVLAYHLLWTSSENVALLVFSHIARLTQGTPAHNALHCQVVHNDEDKLLREGWICNSIIYLIISYLDLLWCPHP